VSRLCNIRDFSARGRKQNLFLSIFPSRVQSRLTGRTSLIGLARTPRSVQDSIFIIFIIIPALGCPRASNPDRELLIDARQPSESPRVTNRRHRKLVIEKQAEPQRVGFCCVVSASSSVKKQESRGLSSEDEELVSEVFQVLLPRTGTG